ncbi:MAG: AAA family ATPase, partial [Methanofollis sp.]|nr:AAA family ATPase [Methanofollis sp.]
MTSYLRVADETLFRDPDLFEPDHLPEIFNHRDSQIEELAFALRPTLHGARPLNTILQGPPGTGKTTAVRLLFAQVREATMRVVPVLVSCRTEQTAYAVFSRIYLALFGHPPPAHGLSSPQVLSGIGHALARRGEVLVVCLDDASFLAPQGVLNDVLLSILRLHESCPGARIGMVMTDASMDPGLASTALT